MPPSPERRSAADLQRILDSMIGDTGFVLAGDLPDVLSSYESKNDLIILDPSEYQGLRALCEAHADMELGPSELFQFLSMIQKAEHARSPSPPVSSQTTSAAQHDSTDRSTPTQPARSRRRVSDRIRSPSDSSGTSSEEERDVASRPSSGRQSSEPVEKRSFPAAPNASAPRPQVLSPRRQKTLSDPSRFDSPLAMRVHRNGGAPPSSFGGFARPSPASRRRRGSSGAYTSDNDEGSPATAGRLSRATSQQNVGISVTSPTWSVRAGSMPISPISPGIDRTSFHIRAKSPEEITEEEMRAAEEAAENEERESIHNDEVDESEDIVGSEMTAAEALNPRLSRISTESTTSLRTSHDKLQILQKQNADLTRKLKESEKQLSLLGADNDQMVVDLERQLEEARHELAQKRKEDKELRGHELKQNIQISGLEADLANVQRNLEQSKEHRANMQKMYDSQCDEAQRLRDLLRDRDLEIRNLEESAQEHEADEEKFNREIQALEAEIKRLEADLAVARRAESVLETQKQENLQLKETIDRMRFDLDEARAAAANAGRGGHNRLSTNASSAGGTMSRNLGDEISRRLLDAEAVPEEKDEDGDDEDGFVETIVTTQRTRKVGIRKPSTSNSKGESTASHQVVMDDTMTEYADASVLTDPVEILPLSTAEPSSSASSPSIPQDVPPAYSAQPELIDEQEILGRIHPHSNGSDISVEAGYEALVKAAGLRCLVLEEQIKTSKQEKRRALAQRASLFTRATSTSSSSEGTFVSKYAAHIVAAFAVGLIAGSHFLGGPASIHSRDLQLWATFNDLAASTGAGEGFLPQGATGLIGASASAIVRVPT